MEHATPLNLEIGAGRPSNQEIKCPHCGFVVHKEDKFCTNCGKPVGNKSLSTSIGKQILIYSVSFFLTPFGLGWAFSYIRSHDSKARIIGIISLILTILSIVLMLVGFGAFMSWYGNLLNSYSKGIAPPIPSFLPH